MSNSTTPDVRSATPAIISAIDAALTRGSNLLVIGPVTAGKTTTAKHFIKTRGLNAALVEAPREANEKHLYRSILDGLESTCDTRSTTNNLLAQVLAEIKSKKVQMVIIDELNGIFSRPKYRVNRFIDSLVSLSTKAQIPFVLLSDDSVLSAIHASPVLVAHFPIVTLPVMGV